MLTREKILERSLAFKAETKSGGVEALAFSIGATWANDQNDAEIVELVEALRELNSIVRSNFGINHAKASELLKKYEK